MKFVRNMTFVISNCDASHLLPAPFLVMMISRVLLRIGFFRKMHMNC